MTDNQGFTTDNSDEGDPPVTVMVTRKPVDGKESEFEDYVAGITQAAMQWPGHMGTNVFRPDKPDGSYRIVFKFDHLSNLEKWENSKERGEWREIAEQVSQPREIQTITGMGGLVYPAGLRHQCASTEIQNGVSCLAGGLHFGNPIEHADRTLY